MSVCYVSVSYLFPPLSIFPLVAFILKLRLTVSFNYFVMHIQNISASHHFFFISLMLLQSSTWSYVTFNVRQLKTSLEQLDTLQTCHYIVLLGNKTRLFRFTSSRSFIWWIFPGRCCHLLAAPGTTHTLIHWRPSIFLILSESPLSCQSTMEHAGKQTVDQDWAPLHCWVHLTAAF